MSSPEVHATRSAAPAPTPIWRPRHNPWLVALTVTLATFMEVLDTSIANVALPHIAGSLAASRSESTWVLTSYLVSNAIVLPVSAWLSSVMGRKRFYMSCVALFTLSSALCGMAPSLGALVFFRVVQGAGGGGLQPSEQAILADTFAPAQRGMAFAIYGVAVVCAPVLGPTLGGWITDNYSWRWIFYINVPVGIVSLLLTHLMVEDPPGSRAKGLRANGGLDTIGLGLIALGFGALQVMLDKGQEDDWFSSPLIRSCAALSAVGLIGTIIWELRHPHPIVNLRLLAERNFATALVLLFVMGVLSLGSTTLLPLYLQTLMGYTATEAGLALTAGAVFLFFIMPVVGALLARFEARWLVGCGLLISAYGLMRMAGLSLDASFGLVSFDRVVQSAGLPLLFVPLNTAAYLFMPPGANNQGSSLTNLARNIGQSVGASIVSTFLDRWSQVHQGLLVGHLTPFATAYRFDLNRLSLALAAQGASIGAAQHRAAQVLYDSLERQSTMLAVTDLFRLMAFLCLAGLPLLLLLKRYDPRHARAAVH